MRKSRSFKSNKPFFLGERTVLSPQHLVGMPALRERSVEKMLKFFGGWGKSRTFAATMKNGRSAIRTADGARAFILLFTHIKKLTSRPP